MLFILAMDVLGFLIIKAESEGLLQPLSTRVLQHRVSFYVDDVVLFLRPTVYHEYLADVWGGFRTTE
jgi:hypothetical protein